MTTRKKCSNSYTGVVGTILLYFMISLAQLHNNKNSINNRGVVVVFGWLQKQHPSCLSLYRKNRLVTTTITTWNMKHRSMLSYTKTKESLNLIGMTLSSSSSVVTIADRTNASFTVPRFYKGEIYVDCSRRIDSEDEDEGHDADSMALPYPSPLHSIHVVSILSDEEATHCLELVTEYGVSSGSWEKPDSKRHSTYPTCDFPIESCESIASYLDQIKFNERIFDAMNHFYGIPLEDMSYLDFFCAHYRPKTETNIYAMDRLQPHRDGSLVSFTITLTPPDQFTGGGTFFDALRDVDVHMEQSTPVEHEHHKNGTSSSSHGIFREGGILRPARAGDAVVHCGKLLHGAHPVLSGSRTVLVGFVDVAEWLYRPGVLTEACTSWGRMDVASFRYKRQLQRTTDSENVGDNYNKMQQRNWKGWFLNNQRWIAAGDVDPSQGRGRSYICGFCPTFEYVERRAQPDVQRLIRLDAEDVLLRSILLLHPNEYDDYNYDEAQLNDSIDMFDGDVTVL